MTVKAGTSRSPAHEPPPGRVGVVGSGLIGTSIGLALSAHGVDVLLADIDNEQVKVAEAMGAGRPWHGEPVGHAVIAIPPHAVAGELRRLQQAGIADTFSDVASVKARPITEAVQAGCDLSSWCPAHPIAGRERGGAASARVDLFAERTWVICPVPHTSPAAVDATVAIARTCGATPVRATPGRHDTAMAALSHLPQVVASLLAATAPDLGAGELALAGPGFRDITRLADSDPGLWSSILEGNRGPVAAQARRLAADLTGLVDMLDRGSEPEVVLAVRTLVARGNAGRALLPSKTGAAARPWVWVGVVLADRPGQLGALFTAIGDWQINIEDIAAFEHNLDAPAGIVEIAVSPDIGDALLDRLAAAGWTAYRRS
ncbi:prephenate dehydrogenase [Frankia sp. Cppng1_Ct_nod]|uniref:prephenate dehydrogenase n=1 Tax=Frankia sp. Cppng1_Ct_nod TaxID=2897162 RepID=UPI0010411A37|nr:prephenate dehydrogenase [Frankia sp. Cppng1_Ct_nod]